MKFVSTRDMTPAVSFQQALFQGLADDKGLFIPETISSFTDETLTQIEKSDLHFLAENILSPFLTEIPADKLHSICADTLNFPIPLIPLEQNIFLLEVFHGPTFAFKDVGARFMAKMVSYFLEKENKRIMLLVATSGDTGSAIAHAFHNIPQVDVFILYPSKKITTLQEQQITTLGGNIHSLEIAGTFDDCQTLVKTALSDATIRKQHIVTTANSINIARLLPQIIYHSWGLVQLLQQDITTPPILSVPSGNFGNLVAAIYAKKMGFKVNHFIAATNINAIVPDYLHTGNFTPQPSRQSFSNAMDVGNPSNFERLLSLYANDYQRMGEDITGISISDEATLKQIHDTYQNTGYILDPHTAVGVAAAKARPSQEIPAIVTSTAHPAKFPEVIKRALNIDVELPEAFKQMLTKPKLSTKLSNHYADFKKQLLI